jgi:diacylglycerol kinase (ATP)
MKVFLLFNPTAGGGRARKVAAQVADLLQGWGADLEMAESVSAEDLTRRAGQAAGQGFDRIVVVGGDGTWHFALNGLAFTGLPAAMISCGRGNDYRRNVNLPKKTVEAARVALEGPTRDLDLIWTGRRYYIGVGGVGFDSEVTECANTQVPLLVGTAAYSVAVFYKLLAFKPKRLKIVYDHGSFEGEVMFAVFGNSKSYGGGMYITPQAVMDDGLIDVLIVEKIGIPNLLFTMPKVFSGRHIPHPHIKTLRTTRAELSSPDKMDLYGDGEYIEPVPVTLEIKPRALKVVIPPE